ncbi:hypothetical protein BKH41_03000 [Helicobacter sp. 12S02232-10]|uniref:hypothetical protein n=1 Tax=Helicobacter sp. 12S02232-10 TaxID=1476197 RepID=UPI000BA754E6|nr:hypothetical protein [Helicobacter sp. 12S02232-10]PAF49074.1 hypothetical protein BKH41_03000 [Helicobacter sp. 12S02232-10]
MRYTIAYDTQLLGAFYPKGKSIEFPKGTDENYIHRLLRDKVITEEKESEALKEPKAPKNDKNAKDSKENAQ